MTPATSAANVLKWLANYGGDVAASADDLAQFGPQAARVRALLDFISTMSDEAKAVSSYASSMPYAEFSKNFDELHDVAWDRGLTRSTLGPLVGRNESEMITAAMAEGSADLISPRVYTAFTNPLAAGRAVDVLRTRPRNQGTPFLDVARRAGEVGAISGPRDVVATSRIARSPEDVREIALTLMADGMSAEEAMRTARML